MTLIGIGGPLRAGKDEFANVLVREYGFTKLGMSDVLRDALVALNPLVRLEADAPVRLPDGSALAVTEIRAAWLIELVGYTAAKKVREVRRLLQVLGTEVGRNMLGEDVWVNAMELRIDALDREWVTLHPGRESSDHRIVVTGIRFDNELEMIENLGGESLYISRREALAAKATHASELSIYPSDFSCQVHNDGTLEELAEAARRCMRDRSVSPMSDN